MTGYYNFLNSKVTINGELNKIGEQIDSLTIELHQTKNILQSKEKDHLDLIKKFVALREENEALKQENEKLREWLDRAESGESNEIDICNNYRKALEEIRDNFMSFRSCMIPFHIGSKETLPHSMADAIQDYCDSIKNKINEVLS